ncbi:DUF2554 family protein [Enterobacter asburiae]|uniref:DUF2554 family protein n=1 Tax=unclassified Scandinavium TaxID=2830652 RepID=UPI0028974E27|nr:DUF2554 family protein [Scandinavium sp.]
MFRKGLSIVLLLCSLFSGQLMANANGHEFYQVENADHWMRHNADSDDIRARFRDAADELREDHHTIKERKPEVIHL